VTSYHTHFVCKIIKLKNCSSDHAPTQLAQCDKPQPQLDKSIIQNAVDNNEDKWPAYYRALFLMYQFSRSGRHHASVTVPQLQPENTIQTRNTTKLSNLRDMICTNINLAASDHNRATENCLTVVFWVVSYNCSHVKSS